LSTSYSDLPSKSIFLISTGLPKIIFLASSGCSPNSNNLLKSFFCSSLKLSTEASATLISSGLVVIVSSTLISSGSL
jgi:hypothetical protein